MKNVDSNSPTLSPEIAEQTEKIEDESRGRSKRRTAKEIAQMFEQLKQRHLTRKKEWQLEKDELLKKAALAEESKCVLVELKRILEDLRIELRVEERKRLDAEDIHAKERAEWEIEKANLLRIIETFRSQKSSEFSYDKSLVQELDLVKFELQSRNHDLAEVQRSNTEIQKKSQELRRTFEEEKLKLIREHEGEKRNWDTARQVMLDRINELQDQAKVLKEDSFPLHGSHVSASERGAQFLSKSSDVTDSISKEINKESSFRADSTSCQTGERTSNESTVYNQFQRTVDNALCQIDKLTNDMEKSSKGKIHHSSLATELKPLTSGRNVNSGNNADRSRSASLDPSLNLALSCKPARLDSGGKCSVSSFEDRSDISKSPCANYSCVEQKEICEKALTRNESEKKCLEDEPISTRRLSSFHSISQNTTGSPDISSPTVSVSPASCSIPTFTESSTDSPYTNPLPVLEESRRSSMKSDLSGVQVNEKLSRSKPVKQYQKTKKDEGETKQGNVSPKKLPNLHQTLLFGNASKLDSKHRQKSPSLDSNSPQRKENNTTDQRSNAFNLYLKKDQELNKGGVKYSPNQQQGLSHQSISPKAKSTEVVHKTSASENIFSNRSAVSRDFIEKPNIENLNSTDFVSKPKVTLSSNLNNFVEDPTMVSSLDGSLAPPIRPKPNVTIEKDTKGNLVRVIGDAKGPKIDISPTVREPHSQKEQSYRTTNIDDKTWSIHKRNLLSSVRRADTLPTSGNLKSLEEKAQPRESLGSRGKTWIKKRLPFLDSPQKEEMGSLNQRENAKKAEKYKNKSRSSSLKRREERKSLIEVSTSEESDDPKNRERFRQRRGRKEHNDKLLDPKTKTKKYTRSKTDSPLEMKNLLSKFRASQFNSKKPSIVKQFERRLLENEIKTLDEGKSEKKTSPKTKESLRNVVKVREKTKLDDDGYSGEDELEDNRNAREMARNMASSFVSGTTTPSMNTLKEKQAPLKVAFKPRFHKSLVDLHCAEDVKSEMLPEFNSVRYERETERNFPQKSHTIKSKSPQPNYQYVRTSFTSSPKGTTNPEASFPTVRKLSSPLQSEFVRSDSGRQSLPATKRYNNGKGGSKRLSWATNLDGNSPENNFRNSITPKSDLETTIENSSTCVSSMKMVMKKSDDKEVSKMSASTIANTPERSAEENQSKTVGRMSGEMFKKAANLEKVLKRGPSKPRRYKRSETQPIIMPPTTSESDTDDDSRGMTRAQSMSVEAFTKECIDEKPPDLTSRFKKPTLSNRRLPSRWVKKPEK